MTSKLVDQDRMVMARLPFWFKEMARDIGARQVPVKSVGAVLAEMFGAKLRQRHARLPKLGGASPAGAHRGGKQGE